MNFRVITTALALFASGNSFTPQSLSRKCQVLNLINKNYDLPENSIPVSANTKPTQLGIEFDLNKI